MAHYFVGDIQGCFNELQRLLQQVDFNPSKDQLWAVGDLIARGPDSLATLRFFAELEDAAKTVLGNHDLHLLATHAGLKRVKPNDKLGALLAADDIDKLINYIRQQPLYRELPQHQLMMTHAGIPPQWDFATVKREADAVSAILKSDDYIEAIISKMYNDSAEQWSEQLTGSDRLRYCINALTRMRYLHQDGSLDFACKTPPSESNSDLMPWFEFPQTQLKAEQTIVFGHWAALMGETNKPNIKALDTGCCWGEYMTLWHLETNEYLTQNSL